MTKPNQTHPAWHEAAAKQWKAFTDNAAVHIHSPSESRKVEQTLASQQAIDRIMQSRYVLVDKNAGQRTETNELPLRASARIVIPGIQDPDLLSLRRDAPTGNVFDCRTSVLTLGASLGKCHWKVRSSDILDSLSLGEPICQRNDKCISTCVHLVVVPHCLEFPETLSSASRSQSLA